MLKVSPNKKTVTISGSAAEIASIARIIKKSRFGSIKEIETQETNIELICKGNQVKISLGTGKVIINYSEESKNELYGLISMPADTTIGSVFNLRPIDHDQLFDDSSMDLELVVE